MEEGSPIANAQVTVVVNSEFSEPDDRDDDLSIVLHQQICEPGSFVELQSIDESFILPVGELQPDIEENEMEPAVDCIIPRNNTAFRSNWTANITKPVLLSSFVPQELELEYNTIENDFFSVQDEEETEPLGSLDELEDFDSSESDVSETSSVTSASSFRSATSSIFSAGTKNTPSYMLASGPPRICNACMNGIYCGDFPFPDCKKPKRSKIRKLEEKQATKAKEIEKQKQAEEQMIQRELKQKKRKTSKGEPVIPPTSPDEDSLDSIIAMQISERINQEIEARDALRNELETCDAFSPDHVSKLAFRLEEKEYLIKELFSAIGLENQCTNINPLARRKTYKEETRRVNVAKGIAITGGTAAVGTVGGAVVGGVTGFLLGFGVPGAIAGVATGAALGGASGAAAGGYVSKRSSEQRPKNCVNCKLEMQKNKPGFMPYQCRCCWLWFCDRCVPHEVFLDSKTFNTLEYKDEEQLEEEMKMQQEEKEKEFIYIPTTRQAQRNYRTKRTFSLRDVSDVDEVSTANIERTSYCSWCFQKTVHLLVKKSTLTRNVWQCNGCVQRTLICRTPRCHEMTRGLVGYDEESCWKCQGKISSWETAATDAEAKQRNSYCSWCFELTQHDPMCHTRMIRVFKCRICRNTTIPCSSCPKGDGWGMARDNGFFWKGKCALHAKHIKSWDDPEYNRSISELRDKWCPWCVEQTTHTIMGPGSLINRKISLICKNCHQRTYHCSEKCDIGLAKHTRSKCLPCKFRTKLEKQNKKGETKLEIIGACGTFDELVAKKHFVYSVQSCLDYRTDDLRRKSLNKERERATAEGYLRPFLLLVSMEPQMRVLTAATLGMDLIVRPSFGDAHAEAWEIIGHHKKGLIFRTRKASEEVTKLVGCKSTWYTTLRRAMRASVKATTFKSINAKRSKESCRNPDLNVLPEMELEFLEKLAHWQHVMLSPEVSDIADQVMNNPELDEQMKGLEKFGLATETIRRFLAESFAEASLTNFEEQGDMLTEFLETFDEDLVKENAKKKRGNALFRDDESVASGMTGCSGTSASTVHTFKSEMLGGAGSTYQEKAKVVNYTAASIPAAYVKLTVWFFVGAALAVWLGPVGWALEWGASIALGAVVSTWVAGELYLGPSHEVMTPAVVMICMQRLTLAGEGLDITEFM